MVDELVVTRPLLIAAEWLKAAAEVNAIVAKRVSWKLDGVFPAIRLADLGPMNRTTAGSLRRIQVECWAESYDPAEELAAAVERAVASARGQWTHGYCAGASVEAGPFANPDPNSQRFRHQLDVALALYAVVDEP